jgi:23S rRNA pseudouridine1911/1915/1917 synthase
MRTERCGERSLPQSPGLGPQSHTLHVSAEDAGTRLDKYLASRLPDLSRSQLQRLIQEGQVQTSRGQPTSSWRVQGGECITVWVPPPRPARPAAEEIPLHIIYEDEALLVINKPPGLVVHPAPGHHGGTLVNALLFHCTTLSGVGGEVRPGIVHRLDKDTSGLLLVAKHDRSHRQLAAQLEARRLQRRYIALVRGHMPAAQGTIDAPIGRHPRQRKKMAVVQQHGRRACTHYEVLETWGPISMLRLSLDTGRTHQIRVHLAHVGRAVVGDPVYGAATCRLPGHPALEQALRAFPRQALHAAQMRFQHPANGEWMEFTAPLPDDVSGLITQLRQEYTGARQTLPPP